MTMQRKIAIHQPEHLPWLGYFDKMKKVDLYVFLDNVQYRKNYFQNRNRIPTGWLTVPVISKGHTNSTLKDIKIDNTQPWKRKYWGKLSDCYRKCPKYHEYKDEITEILNVKWDKLVDINYAFIAFFRDHLKIHTPILMASELGVKGNNSALIMEICKKTGATSYLSGPSGRKYLDKEMFKGMDLEFHDYPTHNTYSALDHLMRDTNGD